ncbi:TetR/AcrR family transcriptional regulator, partial [Rhizobium ruizarguesonis]
TTVADIARDLGMSPANIYRFFASKLEIHQALCGRMLAMCYQIAYDVRHQPASAIERLRRYVETQYQWTLDVMLDRDDDHLVHLRLVEH